MSLPQSTIDQYSRTKIGVDAKARGKSRKIIAEMLVTADEMHADFYKYLGRLFPELGEISTKSVEYVAPEDTHDECADHCTHDHFSFKAFDVTPAEEDRINRQFRSKYPSQYQKLLEYADQWISALMPNNLPNQGAPLSKSYWEMLQQGAVFGWQSAMADKARPNPTVPIIPFIVNSGDEMIKKVYTDGYGLVSSQITKGVLAPAMDAINKHLSEGKSWDEIGDELTKQFGQKRSHWLRLINSELGMAANAGTMAQARAIDEPATVIKWSTTAGSVCPVCGPRNGLLYELDAPEVTQLLPHPNCKCARIVTFRKRKAE